MQRVVVIGGGFAGSYAAKKLEQQFDVTLVDTKDYFEFTPGILRSLVQFNHLERIQVCHTAYLRRARVVVGTVANLSDEQVQLADGQSLGFDYLLVATGSRYVSPIKDPAMVQASRAQELHRAYDQVKTASRMLVIGGGLVGVELCAEIATAYPGKKITLLEGANKILGRSSEATRRLATEFLTSRGVSIICNEMLAAREGTSFVTKGGTRIEADLAFMCTGIVPNGEAVGASFPGSLNDRGFVKVEPTLQLPGHPNILAAGDANDCGVEKTAQNAQRQASLAAANICALAAGHRLRSYNPRPTPMVVSLGPSNGIFSLGRFTVGGILPAFMKWFVERREMLSRL